MAKKRFNPEDTSGFQLSVDCCPVGLAGEFGVSPFSVLDARSGEWQTRKRQWLSIGLDSELGRGKNLLKMSGAAIGVGSSSEVKEAYEAVGRAKKSGNQDLLFKNQGRLQEIMNQKGLSKHQLKGTATAGPTIEKGLTFGNLPIYRDRGKPEFASQAGLVQGVMPNFDGDTRHDFSKMTGTSVFDPCLVELCYDWWCPPGGHILDPFSGGSVRGIVASVLDREYTGIDLREEQIAANNHQWDTISQRPYMVGKPKPNWLVGDSMNIRALAGGENYDMLFSCPPYGNLEVYSDKKEDISNMSHEEFLISYRHIIKRSCSLLKPNRFACFVVGDFRDKTTGAYVNFVSDTIQAFLDVGLKLYNNAILLTMVGSLPIRAGKVFRKSRKLGKTHQDVLVFFKGDTATVQEIIQAEFL
jgi:DNA modification methylase